MNKSMILKILVFVVLSYTIAILLDVVVANLCTPTLLWLWGFARMWSVTLSVILCMIVFKESITLKIKEFLSFSKKAVVPYLLAPIIVYSALGVYIVIAMPLGLFGFNAYISMLAETIKAQAPSIPDVQLITLATTAAYAQLFLGYAVAISINAFFALGEEIGWRGYLYNLLGSKPNLSNIIVIGAIWGLWHVSAIVLLGYNYQVNRLLGVALFTLLAIAITFPHLLLVTVSNSVIPASSLHGAFNALWGLTIVASNLPPEQREAFLGLGVLGIVTWVIITTALYLIAQRMISNHHLVRIINTHNLHSTLCSKTFMRLINSKVTLT